MSASFAVLFAATDPLLDGFYGEPFTITPKMAPVGDVNARRIADSSRAGTPFTGVWSDPHARTYPKSRSGHAENLAGQTGDDRPMVDYVTADLAYRAQLGDVVTRVATGEVYTVGDIDEDDITRTTLALTAATQAS